MTEIPDLTCRDVFDFLMDYVDGVLPEPTREGFEAHLKECPSCVAYIDGYRTMLLIGKPAMPAGDDAAAGRVPEGLLDAIRKARRGG